MFIKVGDSCWTHWASDAQGNAICTAHLFKVKLKKWTATIRKDATCTRNFYGRTSERDARVWIETLAKLDGYALEVKPDTDIGMLLGVSHEHSNNQKE